MVESPEQFLLARTCDICHRGKRCEDKYYVYSEYIYFHLFDFLILSRNFSSILAYSYRVIFTKHQYSRSSYSTNIHI